MPMTITNARSELGQVLARQVDRRQMAAHFNLAGQAANTLLHDGHRWKDFSRQMLVSTRRAMRTAVAADAPLLVHASFAFVHAVQQGAKLSEPLQSCSQAILEAEALVLDGPLPACVLRLGYLYGPESADLLAYRVAFALGRPYWSGEAKATQHHLHLGDAAAALMAAAKPKNAGKTFYATDGHPLAFEPFMDAFAHRVGRRFPLHLPLRSRLLARAIVRPEHMQQTALPMPPDQPKPRVPGWKPKYADYRQGLDQVIGVWREPA